MIHSILESLSVRRHFFIPRKHEMGENFIIVDEFSRGSFAKCSVVVFVLPSHIISLTLQRMLCKKTQNIDFTHLKNSFSPFFFVSQFRGCPNVKLKPQHPSSTAPKLYHYMKWNNSELIHVARMAFHICEIKSILENITFQYFLYISNGLSIKRAEVNDELFIGKYEEVEK